MAGVRVSRVGESYEPVDASGEACSIVSTFLGFLRARRCSPNTEAAYAYDLAHFFRFLEAEQIGYHEFTPAKALRLLSYLREVPNRHRARRLRLVAEFQAMVHLRQGSRRKPSTTLFRRSPRSTST